MASSVFLRQLARRPLTSCTGNLGRERTVNSFQAHSWGTPVPPWQPRPNHISWRLRSDAHELRLSAGHAKNSQYAAAVIGATALGLVLSQPMVADARAEARTVPEPAGIPFRHKYRIGKKLGTGTYGSVHIVEEKATGKKYAAKIIKKVETKFTCEDPMVEVQVMSVIGKHPYVVSMTETFETATELVLIMELANGGDLFQEIVRHGSFSEDRAMHIVRQILLSLQHLHSRGICHNDLKPENVLLVCRSPNSDIKLADFGSAFLIDEPILMDKPNGTAAYRAPEVILHRPCDQSIDLWSVGLIAYIMLCGSHPFDPSGRSSNPQIILQATEGRLDGCRNWHNLSDEARDLLTHLLHPDPKQRYTAEQALSHPWLGGSQTSDTPTTAPEDDKAKQCAERLALRAGMIAVSASLRTNIKAAQRFFRDSPAMEPVSQRTDEILVDTEVYIAAFNLIDKDGDGAISPDDLKKAFRAMAKDIDEQDIELLVAEADLNGDGVISLDEFVGMMQRRMRLFQDPNAPEDISAVFKVFDRTNTGAIGPEDLKYVLCDSLGVAISDAQIREIIQEADTIGHGKINYPDFVGYWSKGMRTLGEVWPGHTAVDSV